MTTPEDDVFKRIMDNAKDHNYNKPQGLNPDWYKTEKQKAEEAKQELEEWNAICERQRQKETPIERYCNDILGIKPDYKMTFEEHKHLEKDSWNERCEEMDQIDRYEDFFYEKPDGMTNKEWREKKRLIKLKRKQRESDLEFQITSSPNWLIKETIDKIQCRCTAEGLRNGIVCDTCKLLVKVNDYMMNLFKDAAEGRSSVI